MEWLLFPLVYGFVYWISGLGIEVFLKQGGFKQINPVGYNIIKNLQRRKVMMMLFTLMLLWHVPLGWMAAGLFFVIHFCGYWEKRHMSVVRGLLEASALVPIMFVTRFSIFPFIFCVVAYYGANIIRNHDLHIKGVDWWHWCSFWIGAWIGLAVAIVV